MVARQGNLGVLAALGVLIQIALIAFPPLPAAAAQAEVALFYEELAPHGNWVDYGSFGPVWYPTRVSPNWRPYLDGRWVPTTEGWVFETSEPWGWATYHFGNWMPTEEFGWVWVPGSTWYPATAAWRTGEDFIGWAPIPPPGFIPPPAFAPGGGFIPGTPVLDLLTPPFWIFANAPNLLLGFGQPFIPAFSFFNCGCLAPFNFVPTIFTSTLFLNNFFFPRFAPNAFFVFGPPFNSVALTSNLNIFQLQKFARTVNLLALQNVLPAAVVFSRRPFLRDLIPAPVLQGQRLIVAPVNNVRLAERSLARPGVVPAPANLPPLRAEIPRVGAAAPRGPERPVPEVIRGMQVSKGMGLPPQAELENRIMKPELRRQPRSLGPPAPGITGEPAVRRLPEGRVSRRPRLTPQEENLRTRQEVEILQQQILQSRRLQRGQESLPSRQIRPQEVQPRREMRPAPPTRGAPPLRGGRQGPYPGMGFH